MVIVLVMFAGGVVRVGTVILAQWIDALLWRRQLVAYELLLPRGLTHDQVSDWLSALGVVTRRIPVVLEIAATDRGIRHFMLMPRFHARMLLGLARNSLPGIRTDRVPDYLADESTIRAVGKLKLNSSSHPRDHEQVVNATGALLSALQPLECGQAIRVSWLLAGTTTQHRKSLIRLAPDLARLRRQKRRATLFGAYGRIAVSGASPKIAQAHLYRVYSAFRVLDGPSSALIRRVLPWRVVASWVREPSIPITVLPAILDTQELAALIGFPIDDLPAPGVVLIGNTALQDARMDYGLVLINPKADLHGELLKRLPAERIDDEVVLNPAATDRPVGFNMPLTTDDTAMASVAASLPDKPSGLIRVALHRDATHVMANELNKQQGGS